MQLANPISFFFPAVVVVAVAIVVWHHILSVEVYIFNGEKKMRIRNEAISSSNTSQLNCTDSHIILLVFIDRISYTQADCRSRFQSKSTAREVDLFLLFREVLIFHIVSLAVWLKSTWLMVLRRGIENDRHSISIFFSLPSVSVAPFFPLLRVALLILCKYQFNLFIFAKTIQLRLALTNKLQWAKLLME